MCRAKKGKGKGSMHDSCSTAASLIDLLSIAFQPWCTEPWRRTLRIVMTKGESSPGASTRSHRIRTMSCACTGQEQPASSYAVNREGDWALKFCQSHAVGLSGSVQGNRTKNLHSKDTRFLFLNRAESKTLSNAEAPSCVKQ
jgi:hypothetical protein